MHPLAWRRQYDRLDRGMVLKGTKQLAREEICVRRVYLDARDCRGRVDCEHEFDRSSNGASSYLVA